MPKKDGAMDDNKKTTKDVVNKKQKQMLNQEEAEKIDVLQAIKDRFRDKGLSGFIKKPEKKERKTIGDLLKREEIDPAKIAEAFGGYVVESLDPTKDELERRLMNRILGGDKRTPAEIDKEIRAARRKEKIDRGTVSKVLKGVKSKAEKRKTAPKAGERSAARKTVAAFTAKQSTDYDLTKPVRDASGNIVANPPKPTKKETARKTKEIKDAGRKFASTQSSDVSDLNKFRRSATRTKVKQQELPFKKTSKGIEVKTLKEPRSAKRQKPKISYQDLKKQIDVREPSYLGKSGGKLPVLKGRSKEAIKTQKTYKGQKEFMKGFSFDASGRKAARAAKKSAMATATKKLGRKAAGKAAVGGVARFGAKRIPGVGMAIAAGEAGARMAAGDKVGAAIAGAEGIASMIPGVGTAASAALGAYGVKRDIKRAAGVAGVAKKVKKLARDKGAKEIASTQFAKDANKLIKPEFKPFKALKKKVEGGGRMMGAKTVGGAALRVGGIGMGLDMARRAMFKAPKPKLDTGIVGKRSAGG